MRDEVVPVLGGEAAAQLGRARHVELLSRSTDRGISKLGEPSRPTPSRTVAVDRDHDLGREQAVVAGPALRGVGDVVAEEVVRADRHAGHAERRVRVVGVDDGQPVGDHRSAADRAQERVVVLHLLAEVRAGLLDPAEVVAEPAQVVDDVGAVTEQRGEELAVGHAGDRPVDPVVEAVQGVDLVRPDERGSSTRGTVTSRPGRRAVKPKNSTRRRDQRVAVERPARERRRPRVRAARRAAGPR